MPDHEYQRAALVTKVFTPPLRLAARVFLDLEVSGSEHVPSTGGLVVAANHLSHIDPPVVTIAVGRDIRFIALDDLFGRGALFDRFTLFFGAIPTDRDGAPLGPLREAIGHVAAGGTVGFFPEGRRETYWGETEPKRGAAWLAWMTGAPLLPVAVHGTERLLSPSFEAMRRPSLRVWVEEPLLWDEFADCVDPVGAMTTRWRKAIGDHLGDWWAR